MEHGELTVQQGRRGSVVTTGLSLMQRVALSGRVMCVSGTGVMHRGPELSYSAVMRPE